LGGEEQFAEAVIGRAVPYLKHPSFESEDEVRWAIDLRSTLGDRRFRVSRFGITPYVELGL
jgi:hypothetical protein